MVSEESRALVHKYRNGIRRKYTFYFIAVAMIALMSVYSLSISKVDITLVQSMEIIWNHLTGNLPVRSEDYVGWWIDQIVVNDNAPRTIAGICVGAILAVCGTIMQSVTRNPLTDPYTIGISSAALLGVTISVVYGASVIPFFGDDVSKIVNAFVFALIPSFAIVFVSTFKRTSSTMMILIGIALMYVFSAITTFIKFNADPEEIEEIYEWSLGTLSSVDWIGVYLLIVAAIFIFVAMMCLSNRINVLGTGDNPAISLGENPVKVKIMCFVIISIATAISVCYTGTIGFVGLVGPHLARLLVGNNNKLLIPLSFVIGALMVVGADCIVRSLPNVLPVGVITALIGSPIFLYFLYRQRKGYVW